MKKVLIFKTAAIFLVVLSFLLLFNSLKVLAEEPYQPPNRTQGTVTLPLPSFVEMMKKLSARQVTPETYPVPYIFTKSLYKISHGEEYARVDAVFSLIVYGKKMQEIPLLQNGAVIKAIKVDGEEPPLYVKDNFYTLLMKSSGEHTVHVTFLVKVNLQGNSRLISFQPVKSTVTNVQFVSKKNVKVDIQPSIGIKTIKNEKLTAVFATIPPNDQAISIKWIDESLVPSFAKKTKKAKPVVYAQTNTIVSVSERTIKMVSQVEYSILYDEVKEFFLILPKDIEVTTVTGEHILAWKQEKRKDDNLVHVVLNQGKTGSYILTLVYEKAVENINTVLEVPSLQVLDVKRLKGFVAVHVEGNIELKEASKQGLTRIDSAELPATLKQTTSQLILLSYRFQGTSYQLAVDAKKQEDIPVQNATIDNAYALTLVTEEGKTITTVRYLVKNNLKQYMKIKLPKGAELWTAFVNDSPIKPAKGKDEMIAIPLQTTGSTDQVFSIEITYVQDLRNLGLFGHKETHLPVCDIPISSFNLSLYLPEDKIAFFPAGNMQATSYYTQVSVGKDKNVQLQSIRPKDSRDESPQKPRLFRKKYQERREYYKGDRDQSPPASTVVPTEPEGYTKEKKMEREQQQNIITGLVRQQTAGLLPVKVSIPQNGRLYNFSKLLVARQAPMVNIVYLSDKIGKLLYLLTIIGGLVLGIFLVNRYLDNKKALLSAVIVYLVVMYIINFLFPLFRDSLVVVFLCLLFWIHRKGYIAAIFTRKDKVTEITATEVKA